MVADTFRGSATKSRLLAGAQRTGEALPEGSGYVRSPLLSVLQTRFNGLKPRSVRSQDWSDFHDDRAQQSVWGQLRRFPVHLQHEAEVALPSAFFLFAKNLSVQPSCDPGGRRRTLAGAMLRRPAMRG